MKAIREMTTEEIAAEMRGYVCQRDRGYAFISYSHRDREMVYPLVLLWMRAGYNIYIDLDFERHGSDSNWADLMLSTLSSRLCRIVVCFKSMHYRYSYAALLELLTMRGEAVTSRHSGEKICVDTFALSNIPNDDELPDALRDTYMSAFREVKAGMGEHFLGQNPREAELLLAGLRSWMEEGRTRNLLGTAVTAEKMLGYVQEAYQSGYQDFYPQIAYLIKTWFISQNLNGNDYSLFSSPTIRMERFNKIRVEQVRENLFPAEVEDLSLIWNAGDVVAPEFQNSQAVSDGTGPRLVRKGTGEVIMLTADHFTLGRSVTSSYVLQGNRAIGRIHAEFLANGAGWAVVDQHSKNGTYLNGAALIPGMEYPLSSGDVIRISSENFVFFP